MTNNNILIPVNKYLKSIGIDLKSLVCKHCGKPLVDFDDINNVFMQMTNRGIAYFKNGKNYVENEQNRWLIRGKMINGKIYRREVCWDCFFEKVNNYIREPGHLKRLGKFRNGKQWHRDFYNGIYKVPSPLATFGSNLNQFLFDIPKEELEKQRKKFSTASKEYWVNKLGEVEGTKKYNALAARQGYTASSQYLIEEKGLSEYEVSQFHMNRASTKENFIKRYGEELGLKYWEEYCNYEAWAGCALEYFIDKFGPIEGKKRYQDINKSKSLTLDNFIKKYGEKEGREKYNVYHDNIVNHLKSLTFSSYSNVSQKLFDELLKSIKDKDNVRYATHNGEVEIDAYNSKAYYFADFTYHNKIIEFNGTFWHADPRFYNDSMLIRENILAKDIHEYDRIKLDELKKHGYDVLVVWEFDYMFDRTAVINKCLDFLGINHFSSSSSV